MGLEDTIVDMAIEWYNTWKDELGKDLTVDYAIEYIYESIEDKTGDFYEWWFGYKYSDDEIVDNIIIPFYKNGLYSTVQLNNASATDIGMFASELCAIVSKDKQLIDRITHELNLE